MSGLSQEEAERLKDSTRRFHNADHDLRSEIYPERLPERATEYLRARKDHADLIAELEPKLG